MAGCTPGQAQRHIAELEASGVLSRDEQGVIFSRRMVSDEESRRRSADNGKLGGNPALTGRGNAEANIVVGVDKGGVKGGVGPQVADVSNLEPTPSSSSSSSSSSSNTVADAKPPADAADPKAGKDKPKKPRVRNLLFDAVAEVTGSDPVVTGSHVAKIAGLLGTAEPPYSPEEVHEFGRRFVEFCPWSKIDNRGRPTLGELEKNIGKVRATPVKISTRTYDALD